MATKTGRQDEFAVWLSQFGQEHCGEELSIPTMRSRFIDMFKQVHNPATGKNFERSDEFFNSFFRPAGVHAKSVRDESVTEVKPSRQGRVVSAVEPAVLSFPTLCVVPDPVDPYAGKTVKEIDDMLMNDVIRQREQILLRHHA